MKNIALTAAAILLATTGAFAGSDHRRQQFQPAAAAVDSNATASIRQGASAQGRHQGDDRSSQTAPQTDAGEFPAHAVPGN